MLVPWLNHVGNWNPQLFRELKGRLKIRNVLLVVGLALIGQLLILGLSYSQLPPHSYSNQYCELNYTTYECIRDAQGNFIIRWQKWWQDLLIVQNWIIMLTLMVPGVYLLAQDLDREGHQGTLNFIRLSPQSPRTFLAGKLLGVPVLFYLVVLCLLPLHWVEAIGAGAPAGFLVSFYGLSLAGAFFVFSMAMLAGLVGRSLAVMNGTQVGTGIALAMVLFTLMAFLPLYSAWNLGTAWRSYAPLLVHTGDTTATNLQWFALDLGMAPWLGYGFTLVNLGIVSGWFWQAMERCFANPGSLLLPKAHSYGLVLYVDTLILGFCVHPWYDDQMIWMDQFMMLAICNVGLAFVLIGLFSNQRQTLLDWARFRHLRADAQQPGQRSQRSLLADLLWGEKSPSSLLLPLNLLLMAGFMVLWGVMGPVAHTNNPATLNAIVISQIFFVLTLSSYGAIAQSLLLLKNPRRGGISLAILSVLTIVPVIVGLVAANEGAAMQDWWWVLLFSPFPMTFLFEETWFLAMGTVLQGILIHGVILAILNGQFARQLQTLGASSSRSLLKST